MAFQCQTNIFFKWPFALFYNLDNETMKSKDTERPCSLSPQQSKGKDKSTVIILQNLSPYTVVISVSIACLSNPYPDSGPADVVFRFEPHFLCRWTITATQASHMDKKWDPVTPLHHIDVTAKNTACKRKELQCEPMPALPAPYGQQVCCCSGRFSVSDNGGHIFSLSRDHWKPPHVNKSLERQTVLQYSA